MILLRDKVAFVHAQKTGGTAITGCWVDDTRLTSHDYDYPTWHKINEDALRKQGVVLPPSSLHRTLSMTEKDVQREGYNPESFRFFTIVRNPWDALRSAHRYSVKVGRLLPDADFDPTMHSHMLRFFANTAVCHDRFHACLRCEHLDADFMQMCTRMALRPPHALGRLNSTEHVECSHLRYDDAERNLVLMSILQDYCERFNYPVYPS